jgi:hypothetical protein
MVEGSPSPVVVPSRFLAVTLKEEAITSGQGREKEEKEKEKEEGKLRYFL